MAYYGKIEEMLLFVYECLNDVDCVLSGDTDEQEVKDAIYKKTIKLGEKFYGGSDK